ncbi:3-oxoacyl-(acyl carrier protein) synthase II [Nostoc sp. NIES-3756]|uniref:beta-ketoacyl-ACP synthase n=1 Tax=Nostoc sp. NIES-3756 TaxID=1751286 RepID=UPI00071F12A8|nr:beta-ketoacyl-ACP synthase [Nostoc sp. NIES-3756]BAT52263.1 3-oxoacyl-(acyl carrier protein) synthase II [Nostoc sp. NIES-3756]BAY40039.1 3-oxoacyl-(acyl carrier protein) synthase II [Nostoc sp. NIES-2111]
MIEVVITGIGLLSALGTSLEESWQSLIAGKSGIKWHQPFPELAPLPLGLIDKKPSSLQSLTKVVVDAALKDALLVPPLTDCAVVVGSSRSYQASWERLARQIYAGETAKEEKLEDWLDTLPHMNAIATARQIGATGAIMSPMAACATGIWAIAQAAMLIQTGQYQRAIAGATEAPITPLTLSGFQQMGALAKTGAYPFDVNREGLVLGEGGAVFVLESKELAKQRQAKIYGEILGFGLTNDAYHSNQLDPEGKGAIAAIKQCLERSKLTFADIDYIHAHGTATQLNDQVESQVIKQLFPSEVAISSTKGSTGHTLGASGALGIAFSLLALEQKIIPPCVGLQKSEFDLNIVSTAQHSHIQRVLCFSLGFGGQNAVIALGKSS